MIKKYFLSFTLVLFAVSAFAQTGSNGFEVTEIIAPAPSYNYDLNDSSDFIIQVRNTGPNAISVGDFLNINYNIFSSNGSTILSSDTSIRVANPMPIGEISRFTIQEGVALGNSNEYFTACADISGSSIYPTNSNKFPGKCSPFIVSIAKQNLVVNNLFYAAGELHFNLKSSEAITAEVFDITGKSLKKINLSKASKQSFPLTIPVKGFYFVKVYSNSGASTTKKFIVNQ